MFNSLSDHLESAFKNIKGQARVTELNVAATLKDIRRALVDADVNYKIAKDFTDRVKEKAIGGKPTAIAISTNLIAIGTNRGLCILFDRKTERLLQFMHDKKGQ